MALAPYRIPELVNAEFYYVPKFITNPDEIFRSLYVLIPWSQGQVRVYGKVYDEPRLTCLFSTQPGKTYTYSGKTTKTIGFDSVEALEVIRKALNEQLGVTFTACLANLYRDGTDKIGMHSDKEVDLVPDAPIASVTLGIPRHFDIHCKPEAPVQHDKFRIDLESGSLLVMGGVTSQKYYLHGVPVQKTIKEPRINLTFRVTKE